MLAMVSHLRRPLSGHFTCYLNRTYHVLPTSRGESFVIAKAGKPVAKVTALTTPTWAQVRRLGFMEGYISVPDDFDEMGREDIDRIFGGGA